MKYVFELNFKDKPECASCMLAITNGQNLAHESVVVCAALGKRPKCPDEGCRKDCPLKEA